MKPMRFGRLPLPVQSDDDGSQTNPRHVSRKSQLLPQTLLVDMSQTGKSCIWDVVAGSVSEAGVEKMQVGDETGAGSVQHEAAKKFVAGAMAGAVAKTAVAPLDRTKILMQVSRMYGWTRYRGGVGSSMSQIWHSEGVRGFFRGNSATVARIMPYAAIQYSAFETYNRLLAMHVFSPDSKHPLKRFTAGAVAGCTSVLMTYPIDVARTVLAVQVSVGASTQRSGLLGTLAHVVRTRGIVHGLYRGAYPTLVGVVPYAGISFLTFGILKRHADEVGASARWPFLTSLLCGGTAGLTAQCFTYPLDMVRRRLQALQSPEHMTEQERAFLRASRTKNRLLQFSITRAVSHIVRTEGLRGLYRGVSINFMKTAPSMAISFTTYDFVRRMLGVPSDKYSATSA